VSEAGAGDGYAPQNPGSSAPPTSPAGGTDIIAQPAQAHELEAKLAEEFRQVVLRRATIAREALECGECARELSRQARERINADFNVDDQHTPPRTRQKLM
jgi:hypothetical protein